jgi:hypothetical protein
MRKLNDVFHGVEFFVEGTWEVIRRVDTIQEAVRVFYATTQDLEVECPVRVTECKVVRVWPAEAGRIA